MLPRIESFNSDEVTALFSENFGYNLVASFTTAVSADALNYTANQYHFYPATKNSIAKEITIDVLYFLLAAYTETMTSTSNLTYAIGRSMRYLELMKSSHASYFGRSLGLCCNIYKKGLTSGFLATAFSFAGSRLGYFADKKLIEPKVLESARLQKKM